MNMATWSTFLLLFFELPNFALSGSTSNAHCQDGKWWCVRNGLGVCISTELRCDGLRQLCDGGSDENNCENWTCPSDKWKCKNHICIWKTLRCDGNDNCRDNSDEHNCDKCKEHTWRCSNKQCIPSSKRCDGQVHCDDSSDERNCTCPPNKWQCSNNPCISIEERCDGQNDCRDSSDEQNCLTFYNHRLSVGPTHFISNGSTEILTMTCNVSGVHGRPDHYQWSVIACHKPSSENTCTFTANPAADDLKNVTCTAIRSTGENQVATGSNSLQLNFSYPPSNKPIIQAEITGRQYLRTGDNLTCTVSGGKPLVDSVRFSCVNPLLGDEDDKRNETSVSSSVTVYPSDHSTKMKCSCSATWMTRPEYYQLTSTAMYRIKQTKPNILCPRYVLEHSTVSCQCAKPEYVKRPAKLWWFEQRTSTELHVRNVQRKDNGSRYTCIMDINGTRTSAVYTVRIASPPTEEPVIQQQNHHRDFLQTGDKLMCTVKGGEPPVDSVDFFCVDPYLPDQDDEKTETSVSSSITVTDSGYAIKNLRCFCNATWEIKPELYQLTSTTAHRLERNTFHVLWKVLGGAVAIGIVVFIISAVLICKRNKQVPETTESIGSYSSQDYEEIPEHPTIQQQLLLSLDSEHLEYPAGRPQRGHLVCVDVLTQQQSDVQDRPLPEPPSGAASNSSISIVSILPEHRLSEDSFSPGQLPEAGVPISSIHSSDLEPVDEIEMSVFCATPSTRNIYDPLMEISDCEDYLYSQFHKSSLSQSGLYVNEAFGDLEDFVPGDDFCVRSVCTVSSDCETVSDDDHLHPMFSSRPRSPNDYYLHPIFEGSISNNSCERFPANGNSDRRSHSEGNAFRQPHRLSRILEQPEEWVAEDETQLLFPVKLFDSSVSTMNFSRPETLNKRGSLLSIDDYYMHPIFEGGSETLSLPPVSMSRGTDSPV